MDILCSPLEWCLQRLLHGIYVGRISRAREMLHMAADLLEEEGILYWIDYGTLLGAYRNGRFIPWDGDIDLSILARDHERVLALNPRLPPGFSIEISRNLQKKYENGTEFLRLNCKHMKEYIDIYHYRESSDHRFQDLTLSSDGKGYYESQPVDPDLIFPLEAIWLEGRRFPCPHRTREYLLIRYTTLSPRLFRYHKEGGRIPAVLE